MGKGKGMVGFGRVGGVEGREREEGEGRGLGRG